MITYGKVLTKAFGVAFRNPALWFFGVFAALLGTGAEVAMAIQMASLDPYSGLLYSFWEELRSSYFFSSLSFSGLGRLATSAPGTFAIVLILFASILIGFIVTAWLTTVSQIAVMRGSHQVAVGRPLSWRELFRAGHQGFWSVFGCNVLLRIGYVVAFGLIYFFRETGLFQGLIAGLAIAATIIGALILRYATLEIILRQRPLAAALPTGWQILRRNLIVSVELSVVLFTIYWVVNVLIANGVLFSIVLLSKVIGQLALTPYQASLLVGVVLAIVQIPLAVFFWSSWTLAYDVLSSGKVSLGGIFQRPRARTEQE